MQGKILVIDDEESIRFTFQRHLEREGHSVVTAANFSVAQEYLSHSAFDVIFVDIILGEENGLQILREIRVRGLQCPVIMITGVPELETAAESVRLGAYDYLSKPIDKTGLLRVTRQALRHKFLQDERTRIAAENDRYRQHLDAIFRSVTEGIITVDPDMRLTEWNEAALRLLQIDLSTLAGQTLPHALDERCLVCCQVLRNTLERQTPVREYRVEWLAETLERQVVIMNSAPLFDDTGAFLGAVLVIRDVTRLTDLERELKDRHRYQNLIGKSPKMRQIYSLLKHLSNTRTSVLITGESGAGKELVAEALHYNTPGEIRPIVKVNCSALAENLLESELFGHVKGAFTGAIAEKIGRFQKADGGTIFLDEIGDISPVIQLKLLRVLQERSFEKVGDTTPIKVDVRIVAATNCNLREKIRQGKFREDLYYRLKVVELTLPPLRERIEDIPLLVDHFCQRFNAVFNKHIIGVNDEVMKCFLTYNWPGNIRELEHAIEHAFVLCHDDCIRSEHLPDEFQQDEETKNIPGSPEDLELLRQALEKTGWNKSKAARLLGIHRRTVHRKINKYGLSESEV